MVVEDEGMNYLTRYSSGFPKIMHLIGDTAYWLDTDNKIDEQEALRAIVISTDEVGKKYVDQQVFSAIKSSDYRSILKRIANVDINSMSFKRSDIAADLSDTEKRKLDNFLQRMKKLKVIRQGDSVGEWVFNNRMVNLYIRWQGDDFTNNKT